MVFLADRMGSDDLASVDSAMRFRGTALFPFVLCPTASTMLKALELIGFKSFAGKTRFEFPSGITAVVGPNGSGKSNVVDAMAWVLGAQSPKAVRSQKMDDVIFAGTEKRAALGRAEVSPRASTCPPARRRGSTRASGAGRPRRARSVASTAAAEAVSCGSS